MAQNTYPYLQPTVYECENGKKFQTILETSAAEVSDGTQDRGVQSKLVKIAQNLTRDMLYYGSFYIGLGIFLISCGYLMYLSYNDGYMTGRSPFFGIAGIVVGMLFVIPHIRMERKKQEAKIKAERNYITGADVVTDGEALFYHWKIFERMPDGQYAENGDCFDPVTRVDVGNDPFGNRIGVLHVAQNNGNEKLYRYQKTVLLNGCLEESVLRMQSICEASPCYEPPLPDQTEEAESADADAEKKVGEALLQKRWGRHLMITGFVIAASQTLFIAAYPNQADYRASFYTYLSISIAVFIWGVVMFASGGANFKKALVMLNLTNKREITNEMAQQYIRTACRDQKDSTHSANKEMDCFTIPEEPRQSTEFFKANWALSILAIYLIMWLRHLYLLGV